MFYKPILVPLLAQVLLTFVVWAYMYFTRFREMNRKNLDPQQLSDRASMQALLTSSATPADNLKNLFELPVLFYVAILLSLVLLVQDALFVQLAWGFVILRAVHSLIHCTYNRVLHRFTAYIASTIVLLLMWFRLAMFVFS